MTQAPSTEEQPPDETQYIPDDSDQPAAPETPPPADPPRSAALQLGERAEQPVIPTWLHSRSALTSAAGLYCGRVWHTASFHTVRIPLYVLKLFVRSPRGAGRGLAALSRWTSDAQTRHLQDAAREAGDYQEFLRLERKRGHTARSRTLLAIWCVLVIALLVGAAVWLVGQTVPLLAVAALLLVLGALGAPEDKPLAPGAVHKPQVPLLTSRSITTALNATGVSGLREGCDIRLIGPIERDGPGYRANIDLPVGVTASKVMEKREELAAGLRRPVGAVWPERDHQQHPGRLVLWVGDRDLARTPPTTWPLAKRGRVDLFDLIPLGADQRGRRIAVELMFNNMLIGAMPRYGKTFLMRLLLLAAALDLTVQLRVFDFKGMGDLAALKRVAYHFAQGQENETLDAALQSLRGLRKEISRRAKTMERLPTKDCPENKITPELASRKDLGLFPIVAGIDECHILFESDQHGDEAGELAKDIIKLGPAVGVILVLATQRPDSKSLPTGVSANAGLRFCFRVMGHAENDMILGTGAHKNGTKATTFTAKDKGIGLLVGNTDDPQIVRPDYIDAPTADVIADRARSAREKAGVLAGQALADDDTPAANDLLDDVAAVVAAGETKLWSETVVARLAQLRPDEYGNWKPEHLANGLKPRGVDTTQVWGRDAGGVQRTRRGIIVADLTQAITERDHDEI